MALEFHPVWNIDQTVIALMEQMRIPITTQRARFSVAFPEEVRGLPQDGHSLNDFGEVVLDDLSFAGPQWEYLGNDAKYTLAVGYFCSSQFQQGPAQQFGGLAYSAEKNGQRNSLVLVPVVADSLDIGLVGVMKARYEFGDSIGGLPNTHPDDLKKDVFHAIGTDPLEVYRPFKNKQALALVDAMVQQMAVESTRYLNRIGKY